MSRTMFWEALRRRAVPASLVGIVCIAAFLGSVGSVGFMIQISTLLTFVVVVVGLYSFVGLSGVVSFGHISFMAIGAYVAGLLTIPLATKHVLLPELPGFLATASAGEPLATVIAGVAAVVLALLIVPVAMRLSGIAAAMVLLAVLVIVNVVISQSDAITGGLRAMTGIPVENHVSTPLVWAIIAIVVVFEFQESSVGLRLRASRDDEIGARALGVNVTRERSVALVLSAFFVGVGGSLYAHLLGAISPSAFYLELTFSTLAMLVVGGMTSLSGAVIGTVAIFALKEVLRHVERGLTLGPVHIPARPGLQLVGVGVVTLLILALRPSGITRGREIGLGSLRRIGSGRPRGGENVPEEGSLAASE